MIVRPNYNFSLNYGTLICLLNNTLNRYFVSLILRAGVVQKYYSTLYPRVIDNICLHDFLMDKAIANELKRIYGSIFEASNKIQNGDKMLIEEIDRLTDVKCIPFGLMKGTDLSGYILPLRVESSEIDKSGRLFCPENLSSIQGDPDLLQYILSYAQLREEDELSKKYLERFPVPENSDIWLKALEKMEAWFDEKPDLLNKLQEKEEELDEIIFDNTKSLTKADVKYIKERIKSHPLDKIIVTTPPGAPTKRIPHKRWVAGERYKE